MHTKTHGWIGQESFNLSRSKSRNKFFALCTWIALIYAAWCSISWYILRHFECESQSPTGSQNKRFSPALQGPRRFLHWVEGLGAESPGDCLFSMENWRIFWDGIASAVCCAPSVGTRNLCHVENRNSACWTKQNTAKGAVCPVSDPAGWRLKEYILLPREAGQPAKPEWIGRLGSRIFVALGSDLLGWPGKKIPSVSPEKGLVPT